MNNRMKIRDVVALGFMTLALFIGAGNVIYPPIVGLQAGENVWIAAAGFMVTAVGLPILTVIALARVGGEMMVLSSPIGRFASVILAVVCYLAVGPFLATPRTTTVSFEVGVVPFLGTQSTQMALLVYSLAYFSVVLLVSLYPTRILDIVGKVLSPVKIVALAILGVLAFLYPVGDAGNALTTYQTEPFSQGFIDGYLTMDALGAMVFGIVIVNAIRTRDVRDPQKIARYATIAGIMAAIGFSLIYISLFKLGNNSYELASDAPNGAVILHAYVRHTFGIKGDIFLAFLIGIACLVTAIGLTIACGTYFSSLFNVSYKAVVVVMVVLSLLVSNLGLTKLIVASAFALVAIHPPCIVLVVLSFLKGYFKRPTLIFSATMVTAFVLALFDAMKMLEDVLLQADVSSIFVQMGLSLLQVILTPYEKLPLAQIGLAWVLPSVIILVIALVFSGVQRKQLNAA